jgi:hypothetical protein
MGKKDKRVKIAEKPQPLKSAKIEHAYIEGMPLAWRFSGCDTAGPFAWTSLNDPEYKQVIEALHEFETKTWQEITATGSHAIAAYRLDKPARDRLAVIEQDDIDEIMSFRLTGTNRVWCIKMQNVMRVMGGIQITKFTLSQKIQMIAARRPVSVDCFCTPNRESLHSPFF